MGGNDPPAGEATAIRPPLQSCETLQSDGEGSCQSQTARLDSYEPGNQQVGDVTLSEAILRNDPSLETAILLAKEQHRSAKAAADLAECHLALNNPTLSTLPPQLAAALPPAVVANLPSPSKLSAALWCLPELEGSSMRDRNGERTFGEWSKPASCQESNALELPTALGDGVDAAAYVPLKELHSNTTTATKGVLAEGLSCRSSPTAPAEGQQPPDGDKDIVAATGTRYRMNAVSELSSTLGDTWISTAAWAQERGELLARVEAAENMAAQMRRAAATWKEEHEKLEAAAAAAMEAEGSMRECAALLAARTETQRVTRMLDEERAAHADTSAEFDTFRKETRADFGEAQARMIACEVALSSAHARSCEATESSQAEIGASMLVLSDANTAISHLSEEVSTAMQQLVSGGHCKLTPAHPLGLPSTSL
jgi:hypothetical protein